MTTLYVRDVPEAVAETLKKRAATNGQSLSAYVSGELAKIASRPSNEEVVSRLRSKDRRGGPSTDEIVEQVQANRR